MGELRREPVTLRLEHDTVVGGHLLVHGATVRVAGRPQHGANVPTRATDAAAQFLGMSFQGWFGSNPGSRGSPSARSARLFRCTSFVPPPIEMP